MLENSEKVKIEQYIDKIIVALSNEAIKSLSNGVSEKQVVDRLLNSTINKLTPESKSILSSVYNMMMEKTLSEPEFIDVKNKASFYEMDILKDLSNKFDFEIPSDIHFEETQKTINEWVAAGAVVTVGSVISISLQNWIPVCIAVVIAGIMTIVLKANKPKNCKDIKSIIDEYLGSVKSSLLNWIDTIERYYDEQVSYLKERLGI